jgi:hypothetical protein
MKIDFHYSTIYDDMLTEMSKKEQDLYQVKQLSKLTTDFETFWKTKEKKIISLIEKHSKLKFKKNITVYFVKHMLFAAISIPLTIRYQKDPKKILPILIHELIHNILSQNKNKISPLIAKTYPEEDWSFRIHIPVLIIQKRVFNEIFGKKWTKTYIKKDREIFGPEWIEVERIENKYKGNIISFLKNENLE